MSENLDDIRREALEILRIQYPIVKQGILRLEVFMRRKSKKAVYELRDFLDHFAMIFSDAVTTEDAKRHICECRTHLRRCVVEPLEYMAEKRFVKLHNYACVFARIPIALRHNPLSKPGFFQGMKEAKEHITEGRRVKTEGEACKHMDKAFEIVTDLLAQISPAAYLLQGILWLIGVFVVGLISGGIGLYLKVK